MKNIILTALSLISFSSFAHENVNTLSNCLIQQVIPGKMMTGAFFTLNHEGNNQEIVAASIADITPTVELHQMIMKDHVMEMQPVESFPVKEGENEYNSTTGNHLMLLKIKSQPELGSIHEISITFNDGTKASCEAKVVSVEEVMKQKHMPHVNH